MNIDRAIHAASLRSVPINAMNVSSIPGSIWDTSTLVKPRLARYALISLADAGLDQLIAIQKEALGGILTGLTAAAREGA